MTTLWAPQALLADGWADDVRVELADGRITSVIANAAPTGERHGVLLPALANLHSHAFQRAMAGMTERRGPDPRDSFWTWRQLMFRFLDHLTPDDVQAITAFVQMQMLQAGYATNVEFHYLHHQSGGQPYGNIGEMAARVAAATADSGIGLTLLPVHYQYGGCDRRALGPGQIRFGNDPARFAQLWLAAETGLRSLPVDTQIGVAPHSLRATGRDDLATITQMGEGPIHMHLAEQTSEVAEVRAAWGARPVEWLLKNAPVGPRWCLIHCTQMEPHETRALAATGAVAGLCPITESSLGDGIFDAVRWLVHGGSFGIGSDSNIRIALAEELRTLEYSQRLRDHSRAALATPDQSTGRRLFSGAAAGGAQAAGRGKGVIAIGEWADLLALDMTHVDLEDRKGDALLDAWIFAGDDRMIADVWAAGRHMVRGGRHVACDPITVAYRRTMTRLRNL